MNFMNTNLLLLIIFLVLWLCIGLLLWYQTKKRKPKKIQQHNDETEDNTQTPLYLERKKRNLLHTTEIIDDETFSIEFFSSGKWYPTKSIGMSTHYFYEEYDTPNKEWGFKDSVLGCEFFWSEEEALKFLEEYKSQFE